jgi:hypothetical protein
MGLVSSLATKDALLLVEGGVAYWVSRTVTDLIGGNDSNGWEVLPAKVNISPTSHVIGASSVWLFESSRGWTKHKYTCTSWFVVVK